MKSIDITVRTPPRWGNEDFVDTCWQGYQSATPGLVVHRNIVLNLYDGTPSEAYGWTITHQPSGFCIGKHVFRTRRGALQAAGALVALADWTKPGEQIARTAGLRDRVGPIVEKFQEV